MLKLSIITINSNNAIGLGKTIESVVSQTVDCFEYIIIDGGSVDGSVDLIKRDEYAEKITYWVSETDNGIYNAMNKGIIKANGEYCLFLNSGDWLVDRNVVKDFLNADFKSDFVSGNQNLYNKDIFVETVLTPDILDFDYFWWKSLPHQSTFIKRKLFSSLGYYNEKLKIFSDWEFTLKALILNNCSYQHYDRIISNFDINGVSYSEGAKLVDLKTKERLEVFKQMPIIFNSFEVLKNENDKLRNKIGELDLKRSKSFIFKRIFRYFKRNRIFL